jgi:hypothetical protein|tara:strand:- start:160 stop:387 length:228 start_codon:yes stop_codon:yes gene_type:complete
MLTTAEQRKEAARLLALDEHGRLQEAVALALRVGDQQEKAMSELVELDRTFIEDLLDARVSSEDLEGEVGDSGTG